MSALTSTYDIPAQEFIYVPLDVPAEQLRQNDKLRNGSVATVSVGTKWVTVTYPTAGNRPATEKFEKGSLVGVARAQETEESKAARQRAYMNQAMQQSVQRADTAYADALAEFNVDADKRGYVDSYPLGSLLEAGAVHRLLVDFRRYAEREQYADMVEAREAMVAGLREIYASPYRHRSLSRSTSVLSNLLEDVDREKAFDFIDGKYWF